MAKPGANDNMNLSIYDIQNQFVGECNTDERFVVSELCMPALQLTLATRVVDVVSEWGSLYVLLRNGRVR